MKPLTIEIHGTGTQNRGAELMAIAIADRMRVKFPGVRIVTPFCFGDYSARARHQFFTTWNFPGHCRSKLVTAAIRMGAPSIRSSLGLVAPSEVDLVLDASGFAFSDQWGAGAALGLLAKMNHSERRHQRLVLLPQALGPFRQKHVSLATRNLFARAEFVCARDNQSLAAAREIGGARRLLKFPDFTLGVRPILPVDIEIPERFAAIVPNYRMMDKTSSGENYLLFLRQAIDKLHKYGFHPAFVLHDSQEDLRVIERVQEVKSLPVLTHTDPRVLKGILGLAELVIGSRFHALVSAMSQGVPCLGVGWSHKYTELFHDFDADELHLSDLKDLTTLDNRIEKLATPEVRFALSTRISIAGERLKELTETMWREVENLVVTANERQ